MANLILSKIKGTSHNYSVKAGVDVQLGNVLSLGTLVSDLEFSGEIYNGVAPTAGTDAVGLVTFGQVPYDEKSDPSKYTIKAGEIARLHILELADIIEVSKDLVEGVATVGQYVAPQNGKAKLKSAAGTKPASGLVFLVDEIITIDGVEHYSLRVISVA